MTLTPKPQRLPSAILRERKGSSQMQARKSATQAAACNRVWWSSSLLSFHAFTSFCTFLTNKLPLHSPPGCVRCHINTALCLPFLGNRKPSSAFESHSSNSRWSEWTLPRLKPLSCALIKCERMWARKEDSGGWAWSKCPGPNRMYRERAICVQTRLYEMSLGACLIKMITRGRGSVCVQ